MKELILKFRQEVENFSIRPFRTGIDAFFPFEVPKKRKFDQLNSKCRESGRYVPMSGVEGTLFMLTMVESVATDEVAGDPVADDAATDAVERFKLFMASILFSMMFIFGDAVLPFAG